MRKYLVIGIVLLVVALITSWYISNRTTLTVTSNEPDITLTLGGKTTILKGTSGTIQVASGKIAYKASKEGFTSQDGMVVVKSGDKNELSIKLRKLYVIEREYPQYTDNYPDTAVAAEFTPLDNWLVVQLVSNFNQDNKTLLILKKENAAWQLAAEGKNYVTPQSIASIPLTLQNWLASNNFVNDQVIQVDVD